MRACLLVFLGIVVAAQLDAATIRARIDRGRYDGPVELRLGVRNDDAEPRWFAWRSLRAGETEALFDDVPRGSYVVLVSGASPLQRFSIETGVGADDVRRLPIKLPGGTARGRVTRGDAPLSGANVELRHYEQFWGTKVTTNAAGELAGPSWLDGRFSATVTGGGLRARFNTEVRIVRGPASEFAINLPNRVVRGRVVDAGGAPLANEPVVLRSVTPELARNRRTTTAPDGSFAFEGVNAGRQTLRVLADGYLRPKPDEFYLTERDTDHEAVLEVSAGHPRAVEVMGADGKAIAGAKVVCAVEGRLVSAATTDVEGRATVATPEQGASVLYVFPESGSLAVHRLGGGADGVARIRVPAGSASLEVAALMTDDAPVSGINLLMRYNGELVPPDVFRLIETLRLLIGDDGRAHLAHIPPGTYEFWPYRSDDEAGMLMATSGFEAPINVQVVTGENKAIVRFRKRG
jgi:hypothetical protein